MLAHGLLASFAMNSQDARFWTSFMIVALVLHLVLLGFFVMARTIGHHSWERRVKNDPDILAAAAERTAPFARLAIAGLPAPPAEGVNDVPVATRPRSTHLSGSDVYQSTCVTCHGSGLAGAPKYGDPGAWGPRVAKGKDVLYAHALNGFQGAQGVMPPRGGRPDLSDQSVKDAVDFMTKALM